MKNTIIQLAKGVKMAKAITTEMAKIMTLTKSEIDEIKDKEELYYSFIRLTPSIPSDEDCEHYKSLPINRMAHINDLLKAGFKLDVIKTYTIWRRDR